MFFIDNWLNQHCALLLDSDLEVWEENDLADSESIAEAVITHDLEDAVHNFDES